MIHGLSQFRVSRSLAVLQPQSVSEVWSLLQSIGVEPYVVLGKDDFDEVLKHGGKLLREGYAQFNPYILLHSATASNHVKALVRELL